MRPLYFLESENTVSLSGILHVFHVCEPLTLTEKKKGDGELLPQGSISKGPAGTAAGPQLGPPGLAWLSPRTGKQAQAQVEPVPILKKQGRWLHLPGASVTSRSERHSDERKPG